MHAVLSDKSVLAGAKLKNTYEVECRDKQGRLKWVERIENMMTGEGLNELLNKLYKGSSYTAAHYVGLIDSVAAGTLGSNPVATTNGSTTVTVTHTSHGLAVGDSVKFAGATAINGVTLNGIYTVVTVPNANSYTVVAGQTASGTSSGGGASMTYNYLQKADTAAKVNTTVNFPTTNGWQEMTSYDEANRQTLTLGSVASQSVNNSASKAVFTISATKTVAGAFVVTNNTKGGTSGIIMGEAFFSTARDVLDDDTLNVTVTLTAVTG